MKDANLLVRISSEKKKQLQAHAKKNGLTSSSLVCALVDEELRRPESLSNMYLSITKRFQNVDEKLNVFAKLADENFNVINKKFEDIAQGMKTLVKMVDCVQEYWKTDHKKITQNLALDGALLKSYGGVLKSIVDFLAKLDEKCVTKDELTKLLDILIAKEREARSK